MKRAALVARVSTEAQSEHGRSIGTQLAEMRAYAALHRFEVTAEIQDDISGTVPIRQRPGGAQLYALIDSRAIDVVIFHTVDRVTRDEDLIEINVIRRDVRTAGLELHYAADGGRADLSTWGGVFDTLKAAGAAEERRKISERTMRNKRAKAAAGQWVGTGHVAYGYRTEGERRNVQLVIDSAEAAVVRRIFSLYLGDGVRPPMTAQAIALQLSEEGIRPPNRGRVGRGWYVQRVTNILRNPAYIGQFRNYGHTFSLPELAIIDQVTFERARERVESRRNHYRTNRIRDYLLTGYLRCTCGGAMCGHQSGYTPYYVCAQGRRARHLSTCKAPGVKLKTADAQVWGWIRGIMLDRDYLRETLESMASRSDDVLKPKRQRLARLNADIARAGARIQRLMATFGTATDPAIADALEAQVRQAADARAIMLADRDAVEEEIGQAEITAQQRASVLDMAEALREIIETADFEEMRYTLRRLGFTASVVETEKGREIDARIVLAPGIELLMGRTDSAKAGLMSSDAGRVVLSKMLPV